MSLSHRPYLAGMARVVPVFKEGDPTCPGNYRPISILSVFSKIFERIIQKRILSFLKKQGSVLGTQYGFRRGHSTFMAIMDMVENIHKAWENDEHCMGIFVDFKKAFDTVDFDILFAKLQHLGIRGLPLKLIKNYFDNRYQFVLFRGTESVQRLIRVGVPQGSILGPLFFLIYINDFKCIFFFFWKRGREGENH